MPEVIDLSTLKKPSTPESEFDNLSEEQQAALGEMAEHNPQPEGQPVRTAFLVFITPDGTVIVTPDLDVPLVRQAIPSADDIYGAVQVVAKDLAAQETAMQTAGVMQQMAHAQMQQMQNQQLAASLNLKGK